jgi:FKBP-type peptidyl-prolyl cis-trans isomerase
MRLAVILLLLCSACRHIGLQPRPVSTNHREVRLTSGVVYEDLFLGSGDAATLGDTLEIDYTLWLEDGTRVDSTLDRGVPEPVRIGEAYVKGLDDGLVGIQVGGRRRILVPPELGFGSEGLEVPFVPPNATLVFEVHVVAAAQP